MPAGGCAGPGCRPINARVAVLGTGAIGLGAAALLKANGHAPVLWSPSGRGAAELAAGAELQSEGALTGRYAVPVAATCRDAVDGAGAGFLALPANGHRAVMDAALPHLAPGQAVIKPSRHRPRVS